MGLKIDNGLIRNYIEDIGVTVLSVPEMHNHQKVTEIGSFSLDRHPELIKIQIPKTIQKIGYHAFYECDNLITIQVDSRNLQFSDLDGILYDKLQTTLFCCPNGLESIHIPKTVTTIQNENAFAGCKKIKNITVDKNNRKYVVLNGVLYEHDGIKLRTLIRCPADLTSLYIPDSITEIHNHAFEGCSELEEIIIPDGVKKLGGYTFKHCHKLKHVHMPKNLLTIGDSCFRNCYALEEMILPYGLKGISPAAFNECLNLKKLIIPESVTYTGAIAYHCDALEYLSCQGIVLETRTFPMLPGEASELIWMMMEKCFNERVTPELKYYVIYQMFIRNQGEQKILEYIKTNFNLIIETLILKNQIQLLQDYIRSLRSCLTAQNLDHFINFAIENRKYEIQIFLTNIKYQRNDFTEKDWTL
ncbi:MAG: leucine-rich repeat protein [Oscillospiraceae bacterium]|nr:leucine-rich repeat protein [Oscillospiraceae bacterium]